MAELYIPDAAYEAAMRCVPPGDPGNDRLVASAMHAGAPQIVAAELRRIAAELVETFSPDTPQIDSAMQSVRARADELDGASS